MKKQDGYVLIFVLAVMTALGIFALAVSSAAIRSYKYEQKSLAALESKYQLESAMLELEDELQAGMPWAESETSETLSDFLDDALNEMGKEAATTAGLAPDAFSHDAFSCDDDSLNTAFSAFRNMSDGEKNIKLSVNCEFKLSDLVMDATMQLELKVKNSSDNAISLTTDKVSVSYRFDEDQGGESG